MKKARIIVLSGQSNAVGVGHVKCLGRHFSEEKIAEYVRGYDSIPINYYSHDKKSDGFTATATNCTERKKDTLGPEVGIAEYLTERFPGEEFYIVKFAVGGASLKRDFLSPSCGGYYEPDAFKAEYDGFLKAFFSSKPLKAGWCYNGLVDLLGDSIAALRQKGMDPQIFGFCWMQGESDAGTPEDAENYRTLFDGFIKDLKGEFAPYLQDCVFVDAGVSRECTCYEQINAFKQAYAQERPDFVYIDTIKSGLTTRFEPPEAPDTVHYDSDSTVLLGRLFAQGLFSPEGR